MNLEPKTAEEIEAVINVSLLIVELCDSALADIDLFRKRPFSIVKTFVRKHPGIEISEIKQCVSQLSRVDREGGAEKLRVFRDAMHDEIPSGRN